MNLFALLAFLAFTLCTGVFVADHTLRSFEHRGGAIDLAGCLLIVCLLPMLSLQVFGLI